MITKSTDHVTRGLSRLLPELRDKPRMRGLITVFLNRVQEVEDAAWEVLTLRSIDDAEGVQLDVIGRIVVRGRNNLNDDTYRLAIKARIRILRSQGLANDIGDVALLSVPEGTLLAQYEPGSATTYVTVGPGDYDLETFWRNLQQTRAAGTRLFIVATAGDNTFQFTSVSNAGYVSPELDDAHGFGDLSDSTGGQFAHVMGTA